MAAAFEVWEDPTGKVRFCFSHSDANFTTGVMIMQPGAELPVHNRPLAYENLLQLSGRCKMNLLTPQGGIQREVILEIGSTLKMDKAQWHIHANPFNETSLTLFKAVGDITEVVKVLRRTFTQISTE